MRVLITGCAGFIGSHLSERLVHDGWEVRGVDAFTDHYRPADKLDNLRPLRGEARFTLTVADVARASLEPLLADRPLVIHLAARPGVRDSFGDGFGRYLADNVAATQKVLEAARAAGCRRVVYASSSSVYGDAEAYPTVEDRTPRTPRSPYGVTKAACEDLAAVYARMGLETVGLRYFTVYGPRQRPDMAMRRICEAALGGPPFVLLGDGGQRRDFTFVGDAVEATVIAALAPVAPPLLNVGGGDEAGLVEVVTILEGLRCAAIPVRRGPAAPGDVRRTRADTGRLRQLGWRPRTGLAEGLRAQLEWVAARHGRPATAAGARASAPGVTPR